MSFMASQKLTEYERKRLENMKINAEMVAALKIHSKSATLSATTKRQSMKDAFRGDEMDFNQMLVETILSIAKKTQVGVSVVEEFDGVNDVKEENLCDFGEKGKMESCKSEGLVKNGYSDGSVKIETSDPWLESLELKPQNVARLLPDRIMVVKFFPCSGTISGILIEQYSMSKIFTICYDGFIRQMDAEKEVSDLVHSCDDIIFSLSRQPNNLTRLYFGED
ncbi:hypothetical protein CRYUN_Cryun33cG0094900 [Craigia yunnanensis]